MAPLSNVFTLLSKSLRPIPSEFAAARSQWQNPTDVLTVLMIIGGDIVQRALASLAGSRNRPPVVAYSFGWVSYSFSAILSVVGDHRLLPDPDYDCILVNAKSGQSRHNNSFILSRLLRDYRPSQEHKDGLSIEFFNTVASPMTGEVDVDWVYILSVATIAIQLILSIVPIIIHRHYMVFILTGGGTILALLGGALPQWRDEKWNARLVPKGKRIVVCLTAGNGSDTVMVIVSDGHGLRLEDLAGGRDSSSPWTSIATIVLAALWIVHLITVQSLATDSWFSLVIGALGMTQNVIAAGAKRSHGALGFHIIRDDTKCVWNEKVFEAIRAAEDIEPRVGLSLLPVFFPGELHEKEILWRDERKGKLDSEREVKLSRQSQQEQTNVRAAHGDDGHDTQKSPFQACDPSLSEVSLLQPEDNLAS